ncbi:MAG TPA: hypothetical protein VE175_07240 [Woeseiaceae bacterium]|nr:hypothetical protein [Woeseiaceae bacterium]
MPSAVGNALRELSYFYDERGCLQLEATLPPEAGALVLKALIPPALRRALRMRDGSAR